jgi:hypothetical protein
MRAPVGRPGLPFCTERHPRGRSVKTTRKLAIPRNKALIRIKVLDWSICRIGSRDLRSAIGVEYSRGWARPPLRAVRRFLPNVHAVERPLARGASDSLAPVASALARRAKRIMRENLAMALLYNAIAIPVAIFGIATPLIAAIAMSGFSVLVTANAPCGPES